MNPNFFVSLPHHAAPQFVLKLTQFILKLTRSHVAITHLKVVCLVIRPLSGGEARVVLT